MKNFVAICVLFCMFGSTLGLRCLKEDSSSQVCTSGPWECHIAVTPSGVFEEWISPILGCGGSPFSGRGLGCRRVSSGNLVYCACNTDNCNTFAKVKKFLDDERQ